jgi:hypothetical protein
MFRNTFEIKLSLSLTHRNTLLFTHNGFKASKDAPMILGRRQVLEQIRIQFHVAPHEMIFSAALTDILDKKVTLLQTTIPLSFITVLITIQQLSVFVDNLLLKLNHEFPILVHDTPSPCFWKLTINDLEKDLSNWNPHDLNPDTPILVVSNVDKFVGPITTTARSGTSWAWAHEMRSFGLQADGVFELQGKSHLVLVLRGQTKVQLPNKKRGIDETVHRIFVPADYTVAQVVKLVRASIVGGVFEEPNLNNLRKESRSAREFGWKDGTTLRLELW